MITDRGSPVPQVTPLQSPYDQMRAAGLIRPARRSLCGLPAPEPGEPVSPALEAMRADERY